MTRAAIGALVLLTGCLVRFGPHVGQSESPNRTTGTHATVTTASQTISGELLEVRDTALVILTPERIALVLNRALVATRFGDVRTRFPQRPLTSGEITELRLASRFPYGVPDSALKKLLESRRQTELALVDR